MARKIHVGLLCPDIPHTHTHVLLYNLAQYQKTTEQNYDWMQVAYLAVILDVRYRPRASTLQPPTQRDVIHIELISLQFILLMGVA